MSVDKSQIAFLENAQNVANVMSPFEDLTRRANNSVHALALGKLGAFDNLIDRHFGSAAENGKDSFVFQSIDRVVAPLTFGHFAAIEGEDCVELSALKKGLEDMRAGFAVREEL